MDKNRIKKMLRESTDTNYLGFDVTRPNSELIILRGIPGSGKSTKAKELKGSGEIFSTDDRIESQGDYNEFFANMVKTSNFKPLSQMHNLNFKLAKEAMTKGVTPVIIDNTNLGANEPKKYIEAALQLGYSNDNIKFVDIGTGGLSAEELADRNTHGVSLDKIKMMIKKYNSTGPLTLDKVMKSKDMFNRKPKLFASLVLDDTSRGKLLEAVRHLIPEGWSVIAHHMTINFGKGLPEELKSDLGRVKSIRATHIGLSDMAFAVKVEGYPSDNKVPHITIAINKSNGAKPVMSNDIQDWRLLDNYINLNGRVTEERLR